MTRMRKPFPMAFTLLLCGTLTAAAWLLADNHRTLVTRQATKAAEQAALFRSSSNAVPPDTCGGCDHADTETVTPTRCGTGCGTQTTPNAPQPGCGGGGCTH